MVNHSSIEASRIENLGKKFETLALVDRLIEENQALKQELNLKTARLRALQNAVHLFLTGSDHLEVAAGHLHGSNKEQS